MRRRKASITKKGEELKKERAKLRLDAKSGMISNTERRRGKDEDHTRGMGKPDAAKAPPGGPQRALWNIAVCMWQRAVPRCSSAVYPGCAAQRCGHRHPGRLLFCDSETGGPSAGVCPCDGSRAGSRLYVEKCPIRQCRYSFRIRMRYIINGIS